MTNHDTTRRPVWRRRWVKVTGAILALLLALGIAGGIRAAAAPAAPATMSDIHACQLLKADLATGNPDSIKLMGDEAIATSAPLKQAIGAFIEARGLATQGNPYNQTGYDGETTAANAVNASCAAAGVPGAAGNWANQ